MSIYPTLALYVRQCSLGPPVVGTHYRARHQRILPPARPGPRADGSVLSQDPILVVGRPRRQQRVPHGRCNGVRVLWSLPASARSAGERVEAHRDRQADEDPADADREECAAGQIMLEHERQSEPRRPLVEVVQEDVLSAHSRLADPADPATGTD